MAKPATARPQQAQTPRPNQAVATTKPAGALALAEQMPDFMKEFKGQGVENIGASDIETPRIKLLQLTSPECEQFDTAKAGGFWHTIAETYLGETLRIVPIYVDMRAILWRPRHEGGGILARSDDGIHWSPPNGEWTVRPYKDNKSTVVWRTKPTVAASGLLEWGSADPSDPSSQPAATKMYNIAVALPDFPELGAAVLTCQRSSVKPAKKFLGKLKLMGVPSYGTYFRMGSIREGEGSEAYYNYNFNADGFVQDQAQFMDYKEVYERFKELGLQIKDLEGAQDEVIEHGAADPEPQGQGGKRPSY